MVKWVTESFSVLNQQNFRESSFFLLPKKRKNAMCKFVSYCLSNIKKNITERFKKSFLQLL